MPSPPPKPDRTIDLPAGAGTETLDLSDTAAEKSPVGHPPGADHATLDLPADATADRPAQATLLLPDPAAETPRPSTSSRSATLPDKVGRFVIEDELGEGGFGVVYKATDPVLDRTVALKVAKPEMVNSPDKVERFLREAKTAANLRHPNIVPVFDSGQDVGRYFIASAYIAGQTLESLVETAHGPVDLRRAAEVIRKVAEALAYAHGKGVVHRDVKPANTMVDATGEPMVMDFGIAAREGDAKLTSDGGGIGTPAFMAPEQATGAGIAASDQYSLGCTLFQLITGETVFSGSPMQQVFLHQTETPRPPSRVNPAVPRDLERIVLKCLAKLPKGRYHSCGELAEDLRRWLAGEAVVARPPGPIERSWKWVRRNPILAGSLALAFIAMVVGTSVSVVQRDAAVQAKTKIEASYRALVQSDVKIEEALADAHRSATEADDFANDLRGLRAKLGPAYPTPEELRAWRANEPFQPVGPPSDTWVRHVSDDLTLGNVPEALKELGEGGVDRTDPRWHILVRLADTSLFAMYGHTGVVRAVALSPDGKTVFSGSDDMTARAWDARTGVPLREFAGHTGKVTSIAVSPDGHQLLTGSADKTARIWDLETGRIMRELKGHTAGITSVAFVNQNQVVTASDDSTARVWDAKTGDTLHTLRGHSDRVTGVATLPDGINVVTASADSTARMWDVKTGKSGRELIGHTAGLTSVAASPDGRTIVTGADDKSVRVWDAGTGKIVRDLSIGETEVLGVAVSPDGSTIAAACTDASVRLWDTASGQVSGRWTGHTDYVSGVAFGPTGFQIYTAGYDQTLRVWDATPGSEAALARLTVAAVNAALGRLRLSQWITPRLTNIEAPSQPLPLVLGGHAGVITTFAISQNEKIAATGSKDNTVRVWDVETGRLAGLIRCPNEEITCLTVTADGSHVVIWSTPSQEKRNGRVWDVKTQTLTRLLPGPNGADYELAATPDASLVATAGRLELWDITTGQMRFHVDNKGGHGVRAVAITPDGSRVVTGNGFGPPEELGGEHYASVYETEKGNCLHVLTGHTGWVQAVAITADGRRVVTGSWDKTVRVWDGRTGNQLRIFHVPEIVVEVRVTDDGDSVVATLKSGREMAWNGGARAPSPPTDKRWRAVVTASRVLLYPVGLKPDEVAARLAETRPSPNAHRSQVAALASVGNEYGAMVQRSLAHRAYATLAIERGDWIVAYWELVSAELLKPHATDVRNPSAP